VTETNGTHIAGDQTEPPSDVLRQQEAEYLDALEREVASLRRSEFSIHSSDEARQLVREVESMLSQCDGDGCAAWELLRDARAWAKAWKAKAKFDRTAWLNSLLPGIAKAWHKRKWRYRRPVAAHLTRVVYEDDMIHHCGQCGALLQIVRPGKWQCPGCE